MFSETEKRQVMRWIWDQMHRSDIKLPPDHLIFEGEHDLAYLYNCGFVDTDHYSYDDWLNAFRSHRQKNGSYRLTLDDWLSKTGFRYFGSIEPPFDPMTMREGEWSLEDYKEFSKEKILPEITMTYEQFLAGIEQSKKTGDIVNNSITITPERKQKLAETMDNLATPKRRRALDAFQMKRENELEQVPAATGPSSQKAKRTPEAGRQAQKSSYQAEPDRQKQLSGKLSDLLSGSKK